MAVIVYCNNIINNFVWGEFGLGLLVFSGLFSSAYLGFFQLRYFRLWWHSTAGSLFRKTAAVQCKNGKSISRFQSLCTSLAATLGVGNIVGVSTAICIGGPGSVFWMWIAAIVGMMTSYSENVLGIYFRRKNFRGEWSGGAMYYLSDGLRFKKVASPLALFFAFSTLMASFGIGSMGQINKIVINLESAFDGGFLSDFVLFGNVSLYTVFIAGGLFLLASFIVKDGISRIAKFTEKIVPFMLAFFILGSLLVILSNYSSVIPAFTSIFKNALSFESSIGGGLGSGCAMAIEQGFKRGIFSNEAGLGSSVIVHANSDITEPCEQGMWGIFEVFTDTIVVCTFTALVILTSGVYDISTNSAATSDATLVASAFNSVFPFWNLGEKFVAVSIFLFSFTTVLGWNHYGCKAWEYLFGSNHTGIYRILHLLSIIPGAFLTSSLAWEISDTFNGLMMIPNLLAVIFLMSTVSKITKNYINRCIKGKHQAPVLSFFNDIQKRNHRGI